MFQLQDAPSDSRLDDVCGLAIDPYAHLGVEVVRSLSVLGESLGEIETDCLKEMQPKIWGMIESKQCEDELDVVLSYAFD